MTTQRDEEAVRRLADRLSYRIDDDVVESVLDSVSNLRYDESTERIEEAESVGRRSDDEYNALLERYDEPRTEATDGALAGVSFAIKDNMTVRGLTMTCGMEALSFVPAEDAVVVERLLGAGASIVGKANMDGLALGPGGVFSEIAQVRNPVYDDLVPEGSSSGSGASVAAELVDAALGSDTGGSVRKPAAANGLVGVKPTKGLVPLHGLVPLAPSLDTIGPLARDVDTAARALDAMAGHDPRDPSSSRVDAGSLTDDLDDPPHLTFGLPDGFNDVAIDDVRRKIEELAAELDTHDSMSVREVMLDNDISDYFSHVSDAEFGWMMRQATIDHGQGSWYDELWRDAVDSLTDPGLNTYITTRKLPGAYLDHKTNGKSYIQARQRAIAFQARLREVFSEVDLLLMPTLPTFPPELTEELQENPLRVTDIEPGLGFNTRAFNLAGTPAVAVPAGEADGRPVSAQVVAPIFEDRRALQGARQIERIVG